MGERRKGGKRRVIGIGGKILGIKWKELSIYVVASREGKKEREKEEEKVSQDEREREREKKKKEKGGIFCTAACGVN